jgi:ribosomal protein L37AE/L43A
MTPDQITQTLKAFSDNWSIQLTKDKVAMWGALLEDVHPEDGHMAMLDMLAGEAFYPPIARFMEAVKKHKRVRLAREIPATSGGAAVVQQMPAELLAEMKAMLAEPKTHWHGGPDPCPVCGGMKGRSVKIPEPFGDECERCLVEHKNVPSCPLCGSHHRATRTSGWWLCCVCSGVFKGGADEWSANADARDEFRATRMEA